MPEERGLRRGGQRRSPRNRDALRRRLDMLENRMDAVERHLLSLEQGGTADRTGHPADPACSSELIGCLDDCVDDVKDLRKRTRHVRTSESRP